MGKCRVSKKRTISNRNIEEYYGDNIKIIYNAPVTPNIPSYPGFPFRLGSVGNFVRELKVQLNRISNNYPAIPKIEEENYSLRKIWKKVLECFRKYLIYQ